jgi:hypothetical protein
MQSLGIWNTRVLGTFGLREGFHWFLNLRQFCLLQFALLKENAANPSAGVVLVVFFYIRLIMDRDPITMCFSEAP